MFILKKLHIWIIRREVGILTYYTRCPYANGYWFMHLWYCKELLKSTFDKTNHLKLSSKLMCSFPGWDHSGLNLASISLDRPLSLSTALKAACRPSHYFILILSTSTLLPVYSCLAWKLTWRRTLSCLPASPRPGTVPTTWLLHHIFDESKKTIISHTLLSFHYLLH